ncbi:MAG: hypothetical protein FJZ01_23275, partial [Candidatus Sericytochromatia bacterium]|nr:hypothetical protein [Candidatus Tanganyikabacteria bacterium]
MERAGGKKAAVGFVVALTGAMATACGPRTAVLLSGVSLGVGGRPAVEAAAARPADAALEIAFAPRGRRTQAVAGAYYEVRAMYTEAVVRVPSLLADYHLGVVARPNSLTGYSLAAPAPGAPAGSGAPRLRYAQHPVLDDPLFPSLADSTRMVNPVADADVYFLGRGILESRHQAAYPPPVLDVFAGGVPSRAIGSLADMQSAKLGAAAAEALLGTLWQAGVTYDDASGSHPLAGTVQDRPLTDGQAAVLTRYYKWRIPFAATALRLGNGLPLGRLVLDIRVVDGGGAATAHGAVQRLLQPGPNSLAVNASDDGQALASAFIMFASPPTPAPTAPPPAAAPPGGHDPGPT